jgi:hypothetical protein
MTSHRPILSAVLAAILASAPSLFAAPKAKTNPIVFSFVQLSDIHWGFSNPAVNPSPDVAPTTRECPFCLSIVPSKATRCPHCTSELK